MTTLLLRSWAEAHLAPDDLLYRPPRVWRRRNSWADGFDPHTQAVADRLRLMEGRFIALATRERVWCWYDGHPPSALLYVPPGEWSQVTIRWLESKVIYRNIERVAVQVDDYDNERLPLPHISITAAVVALMGERLVQEGTSAADIAQLVRTRYAVSEDTPGYTDTELRTALIDIGLFPADALRGRGRPSEYSQHVAAFIALRAQNLIPASTHPDEAVRLVEQWCCRALSESVEAQGHHPKTIRRHLEAAGLIPKRGPRS